MRKANLFGVDLTNADLHEANLSGADLRWANLCWADLTNADLCEANLEETKGLTEEQKQYARNSGAINVPGKKCCVLINGLISRLINVFLID